ncbi:MAG TPA: DUF5131 family protein [Polyangia bacterium]
MNGGPGAGAKSSIDWTESTWNPVTGCKKISPGCPQAQEKGLQHACKCAAERSLPCDAEFAGHGDLRDVGQGELRRQAVPSV